MILLASDYDRTLNTFDLDLYINIFYLEDFIKKGNLFLLNTGRPYKSIRREINKYKIPYNYLSCNDGNILFDKSSNVLYNSNLNYNLFLELENLKKDFDIIVEPIRYQDNILEFEVIISKISEKFLIELNKIMVKYNLCFKVFKQFGSYHLYIYSKNVNKRTPIEFLKNKYNINSQDIYTIGDHYNDLEMIKDYNGYAMKWAKKRVKEGSIDTCLTVSNLIKKINKRR